MLKNALSALVKNSLKKILLKKIKKCFDSFFFFISPKNDIKTFLK